MAHAVFSESNATMSRGELWHGDDVKEVWKKPPLIDKRFCVDQGRDEVRWRLRQKASLAPRVRT